MGKKNGEQSEEESQNICQQCWKLAQCCCQLPPATGVKIVSIISILIGLTFCCLGVWTIIVTSNNIELDEKIQVMYELPIFNSSVINAKDESSTGFPSLDLPSSENEIPPSDWSQVSNGGKASGDGRKTLLSSTQQGSKKLVHLSTYHSYLLCMGILSICVGFLRTLTSTFLLWNSVEKHSKTPGAVWIFFNLMGTISILILLGVTLNATGLGFMNDFPWKDDSIIMKNDRFNFYLLLIMLRILCIFDIFLTLGFVLVILWFVRTIN